MYRLILTVFIAILFTSPSARAIDDDSLWYERCPKKIQEDHKCLQYVEGEIYKKYPGLISRKDRNLTIKLSTGRTKVIKNIWNKEDVDKTQAFTFIKYFPSIQYGLLYVQFDEGGSYDLIDMKSGNQTRVGGEAVLSPDNRRLAIFNADVVAEFSLNVLAVYLISPKGITQEFREHPTGWGPVKLKWSDNSTILFDKLVCCDEHHDEKLTLRFLGKDITKMGTWEIAK